MDSGLKLECTLDECVYEKGIKVIDGEMLALDISGDEFHTKWNYTIRPREDNKGEQLFCGASIAGSISLNAFKNRRNFPCQSFWH